MQDIDNYDLMGKYVRVVQLIDCASNKATPLIYDTMGAVGIVSDYRSGVIDYEDGSRPETMIYTITESNCDGCYEHNHLYYAEELQEITKEEYDLEILTTKIEGQWTSI